MSHGSLLGKDDRSAYDLFRKDARLRARLDELKAEERILLTANMVLGRQKGNAARRKANLLTIDDMIDRHGGQIDTRLLVQSRMAAAPAAPPLLADIQRSGGARSLPCTPPAPLMSARVVRAIKVLLLLQS